MVNFDEFLRACGKLRKAVGGPCGLPMAIVLPTEAAYREVEAQAAAVVSRFGVAAFEPNFGLMLNGVHILPPEPSK